MPLYHLCEGVANLSEYNPVFKFVSQSRRKKCEIFLVRPEDIGAIAAWAAHLRREESLSEWDYEELKNRQTEMLSLPMFQSFMCIVNKKRVLHLSVQEMEAHDNSLLVEQKANSYSFDMLFPTIDVAERMKRMMEFALQAFVAFAATFNDVKHLVCKILDGDNLSHRILTKNHFHFGGELDTTAGLGKMHVFDLNLENSFTKPISYG